MRQGVYSKFNITSIYQRREKVQNIEQVKQKDCAKLKTPARWGTYGRCADYIGVDRKKKGLLFWMEKSCLLP